MKPKSNIIIYILSMLGGVLTAAFLIVLLVLLEAFQSSTANIVISTLMIASAIILARFTSKPFLDAIYITFYIAGCTMPFFMNFNIHAHLMLLIGVSIATFVLAKGFMLPFLAVILFNTALYAEISQLFQEDNPLWIDIPLISASFLLINLYKARLQQCIPEKYFNYKSLHAGLFVSCLVTLGGMSIYQPDNWYASPFIWACFLVVVHQAMQTVKVENPTTECGIYVVSFAILIPTFYAPYLSGSLLLIFLCFHYRYMKEFATGILLLIYTVSKYYYDLNLTLLTKSMLLFSTGIVLLIAWYLLTQKKTRHEEI